MADRDGEGTTEKGLWLAQNARVGWAENDLRYVGHTVTGRCCCVGALCDMDCNPRREHIRSNG